MKLKIRAKVVLSMGLIILIVAGLYTVMYIRNHKSSLLTAVEWRAEALGQMLLANIQDDLDKSVLAPAQDSTEAWAAYWPECQRIYNLYQKKNIAHVAILNGKGMYMAHTTPEMLNTTTQDRKILDTLGIYKTKTLLGDHNIYHTLIPIFGPENAYLGSIDIGYIGSVLDHELYALMSQSLIWLVVLLLVFSALTFSLIHVTVTRPIQYLAKIGERLSQGYFIHNIELAKGHDEIALLSIVFMQISDYLRDITGVAQDVATGALSHDIRKRSKRDALGVALQDMLGYLQDLADIASKMAGGDLRVVPSLRSDGDAFGRSMHAMTSGLQALIRQIRASAEQISTTGQSITSFSDIDMVIVQKVQAAVEEMVSTMTQMGASVEAVAHNMDVLSTSVEETSASVASMTTSISNIAANTGDLAGQTRKAIDELNKSTTLLDHVTEKTEISRQLAQETIQDALASQDAMEKVIHSMNTIQRTNSSAVETITQFEQQTQDIGSILDVIDEITDQSALLALNASIIAAQAGAHGRGFAVIADEMRNLANKVSSSTKDIASIVRVVQQETHTVVDKIHRGTLDIAQGVTQTGQAREVLQKIFNSAQRSSGVVTEIADAIKKMQQTNNLQLKSVMERVNSMTTEITQATIEQKSSTIQINQAIDHISQMAFQTQQATAEQLQGVRQILEAVEQVRQLADRNLESSEQIDRTAAELADYSNILLQSVGRFKLGTTEIIKKAAPTFAAAETLHAAKDDEVLNLKSLEQ